MLTRLPKLVRQAKERIVWTVEHYGHNPTYVAFSGGRDSRVVLDLARGIFPTMLAIHNRHEGEGIGDVLDVLCVHSPKESMVPTFLSTVDLRTQLDGTRRSEDKTMVYDGKEIHRSDMPHWFTENGVFGLNVCFPIWDWADENVEEYLEHVEIVRGGVW